MTPKSFSVRFYLQDGHADGVKIISKSKWSGRGLVIPRTAFPEESERQELKAPGVYVLLGPSASGDLPCIFIGAADPVCRDLQQHDAGKGFWTSAIVFACKDNALTGAHIDYLAARLVQLAQDVQRARLVSPDTKQLPELSVAEATEAEVFLAHMLSIFPLLGLTAFDGPGRWTRNAGPVLA